MPPKKTTTVKATKVAKTAKSDSKLSSKSIDDIPDDHVVSKVIKRQKVKAADDITHVLTRPDTYVGSVFKETYKEFTMDEETNKIKRKTQSITPALFKVIHEGIDNAADNIERGKDNGIECTYIDIEWDKKTGIMSIENDGPVIDVVKHVRDSDEPEDVEGMYEPQLVFGRLKAGSNFDDTKERNIVGRNGMGVSLLNIFSTQFTLEIKDSLEHKSYKQEWTNNMRTVGKPTIAKYTGKKNMLKITFKPDYEKLGYSEGMCDDDIYSIVKKSIYDMSMITRKTISFNDDEINVKDLYEYMEYYFDDMDDIKFKHFQFKTTTTHYSRCMVVLDPNSRSNSENKPSIISFANGACTFDGGVHVNEWMEKIFQPLTEMANKKCKKEFKKTQVMKNFWVFLDARVNRPQFDSQMKTKLVSPKVPITVDEDAIKEIFKWKEFQSVMEDMCGKKNAEALKKIGSKSRNTVVEGHERANWAGTKDSLKAILIITEGLSARNYAVRGIGTEKNKYGILPVTGKLLNTCKASSEKIGANKVITKLIDVLNLKFDVDYSILKNRKTLNYGHVMLCCDADSDGSHIEGLILCFFVTKAPTLFQNEDQFGGPFLLSQRTPIIRCNLNKKIVQNFYSQYEYEQKKSSIPKIYKPKHIKGLGTIETKDIPSIWCKRVIGYEFDKDTKQNIQKFFGKDTEVRKEMLTTFDRTDCTGDLASKMSDFLNKQLIKFSIEDCERNLPCVLDGFKEGQRKIIYTVAAKNITTDLKVARLAAFVAELTDYKHGEQNLNDTIAGLAQDFVGKNNVNLLVPAGQFGSTNAGGDDAASARYIETRMHKIFKKILIPDDEKVLTHKIDGNEEIEYHHFIPIVPLSLVNGVCCAIGTGHSCKILNYKPTRICKLVNEWITAYETHNDISEELNEEDFDKDNFSEKSFEFEWDFSEPTPWYKGFEGTIKKNPSKKDRYITTGVLERLSEDKVHVKVLPVGMSGIKFKESLDKLQIDKKIVKYDLHLSNTDNPDCPNEYIIYETDDFDCNVESLKLTTSLSTSNMVCFDRYGKIKKYTVKSLIEEYCKVRLEYYYLRVDKLLEIHTKDLVINKNKRRFLNGINRKNKNEQEKLDIHDLDDEELYTLLDSKKYDRIDDSYNYLLDMNFRSVSKKRIDALDKTIEDLENKIHTLKTTHKTDMWKNEINEFLETYEKEFEQ